MLQYNGMIWVQGENGANNYSLAPNSLIPLWDSERQTIFTCQNNEPSCGCNCNGR